MQYFMDILNINVAKGVRDDTKTRKHMGFQCNLYFFQQKKLQARIRVPITLLLCNDMRALAKSGVKSRFFKRVYN